VSAWRAGAIEGVIRLHVIALHRLSSLDEPEFCEAVEEEFSAGAG